MRLQNSRDSPILLTKSQIIAVRRMVFRVIKENMGIKRNQASKQAYEVDLNSIVIWAIREQRLRNSDSEEMEFNIKLDGRSLGGITINTLYSVTRLTVAAN